MDITVKQHFLNRWGNYFPGADLPITLSYTDDISPSESDAATAGEGSHCLVCDLTSVCRGETRIFRRETIRCGGARRYLGFETDMRPDFPYFLSCGIPGEMEGERYKRSPELVRRYLENQPLFEAPGRGVMFKRWDSLKERDNPEIVIFFATPDVLSGLFTLANFDEVEPHAVITPFGSGCSSIVYHPYQELRSEHPRAVLGMFDVSARPCVPPDVLTFAIPWPKFLDMVDQMDESFLTTSSWHKVSERI